MTITATLELAPDKHGTADGYRKGCRCTNCRQAETRRKKRFAVVGPLTTDTADVVAHIYTLIGRGGSYQSIANAASCGIDTIKRAANGSHARIRHTTRARILAVTSAPEMRTPVNATGSIRRVRALLAIGHQLADIQAASGTNHKTLANLVSGNATGVWGRTAAGIAEAYDKLSVRPGQSQRARNRALREGWAPPFAWINIDNPHEIPDGWERQSRRWSSEELAAEAEEIRSTCGIGWDLIAERLGVKLNALEKARERVAARAKAGAA